jgi:ABC-type nitrate/sulfonate/bicarbonate transport system substrate-binding protein
MIIAHGRWVGVFVCTLMVVVVLHIAPAQAGNMKVQIWAPRDAQSAGALIVAQKRGFFKKAGLDSELKFVSSGQEIPAGMAGGTISLGVAAWTNPMALNANGIPVVVLSKVADISPALGVLVREKAGIKTAKDLEGKKLGITRISVLVSVLERGCAVYGCDVSKITLVNMQPQDIVLAYQRGDVDAVMTNEPWTTYVQDQGGKWLFSAAQSFVPKQEGARKIDTIYTALFAPPSFVKDNPKIIEAVLRGLNDAIASIKTDPQGASEVIGRVLSIPPRVVASTLAKVNFGLGITSQWADEYDKKADYLLGIKELRKTVVAKDVFAPDYLKAVCDKDCNVSH